MKANPTTTTPAWLPASEGPLSPERRRFVVRLSLALGGLSSLLIGVPFIGFLVAPLLEPVKTAWRAVGAVDKFTVGSTVNVTFQDPSPLPWAGVSALTGAWLRRETTTQFIAFSVNCTHLGCPVRWVAGAELFLCPCHGGVYYKNGAVAAGPPPYPLQRYPVRINNGQVEILAGPLPLPLTEKA